MRNHAPSKQPVFVPAGVSTQRNRKAYRTAKRIVALHAPAPVLHYSGAQAQQYMQRFTAQQ